MPESLGHHLEIEETQEKTRRFFKMTPSKLVEPIYTQISLSLFLSFFFLIHWRVGMDWDIVPVHGMILLSTHSHR